MICPPDERERLPAPHICRSCAHWEERRFNREPVRQWCLLNKPQHEGCQWHAEKTPSLVADRGQT